MADDLDRLLGKRLIAAARLRRDEARVETAIKRALARHRPSAMSAIRASAHPDPFDVVSWDLSVDEEVAPVVQRVLVDLASGALRFVPDRQRASILAELDLQPQVDTFVERIRGLGLDVAARLGDELQRGVALGESVPKLGDRVQTVFDVADSRADTIARTEVHGASELTSYTTVGAAQEAGLEVIKTWLATLDDRTRPDHALADGQSVAYDQPFDVGGELLMYPGDETGSAENVINCFIGETVIIAFGVSHATSRAYEGDVVTVSTANGRRLTGTPNHPVLTELGWRSLSELDERMNLVCCQFDELSSRDPDIECRPVTIAQASSSFSLIGRSSRITGIRDDFHGDGVIDGEINVVALDGELRDYGVASSLEPSLHYVFADADVLKRRLSCDGLTNEFFFARTRATTGDVGGSRKLSSFVGTSTTHPDDHRFGSSPRNDIELEKRSTDAVSMNIETTSERELRLPFVVSFDEVIKVEIGSFHGSVHNLQTSTRWFIAEGIVAHNCRCAAVYDAPDGTETPLPVEAG